MESTEPWYTNKALLQAAYEEYGSLSAVANKVGGATRSTLSVWWNKHGLPSIVPGPKASTPNQEALQRLYEKINA